MTHSSCRGTLIAGGLKLWNKCVAWQLTQYGGKYSIERMLALQEFTQKASPIRTAIVAITPPILTLAVVLCQESVPLQDPADGWKANYGFWTRVGVVSVTVGFTVATQVGPWLDVPTLSPRQRLLYAFGVGSCFIAVGMLVASVWVFPIPFFMLSLSILLTAIFVVLFRVVVGAGAFRVILSRREELRRLNKVGMLQGLMCIAYQLFQVLFNEVRNTQYELPVVLLLPIFKLVMRGAMAFAADHKDDILPEEVIFTVDFFDALYRATCMQTLSTPSLVVTITVDLAQTALELYELNQRTQSILTRLRTATSITDSGHNGNLLSTLHPLLFKSEQNRAHSRLRARSCIFHDLSDEARAMLDKLDSYCPTGPSQGDFRRDNNKIRVLPCSEAPAKRDPFRDSRAASVHPSPPAMLVLEQRGEGLSHGIAREEDTTDSAHVLEEVLEILFTTECLVSTEYLEAIVPVLYGVFVLVMVHLPSARYHMEMEGVTNENVHL